MWLKSRENIFNPLELSYSVYWMGLAELNVGWLKGTGVAELAGKHFESPRALLLCVLDEAGLTQGWLAEGDRCG